VTNIIDFPSRLTEQQLDQARTQLSNMLQSISRAMLDHRDKLMRVEDPDTLARVVRSTANDLAEANERWAAFAAVADTWLYGA
jgi:transposase